MDGERKPNSVLRRERQQRGWSQQKVAELVGTSEDVVSRWERGERKPSPFFQEKLCVLYGKSAEELGFLEKLDVPELSKIGTDKLLLAVPSLRPVSHFLHREEVLAAFMTDIPVCWQLYFSGHLSAVQQILFPFQLPQLASLVQDSRYQVKAAHLASKAGQLAALIEMHHQNSGNALLYAKQGASYGELAGDPNLSMAALIQQGNIYFSLHQPWKELEAYQQAYQIFLGAKQTNEVSQLLEGRIYIGLAKSYASLNQKQQTEYFLDKAYEVYPEQPENDPTFSYSCHTRFTLTNHTGLTYLSSGKAQLALDVFNEIEHIVPVGLIPRRVELSIRLATVHFELGNMDDCCTRLEAAVTGATALGSGFRYNEASALYLRVLEKWGHEQPVKALGKYFGCTL